MIVTFPGHTNLLFGVLVVLGINGLITFLLYDYYMIIVPDVCLCIHLQQLGIKELSMCLDPHLS